MSPCRAPVLVLVALSAIQSFGDGCLTSVRAFNEFIDGSRAGSRPFAITGTVTACGRSSAIIQDATGRAELFNCTNTPLAAGMVVASSGLVKVAPTLEHWTRDVRMTILRRESRPEPVRASLAETQDDSFDLKTVTTRAVVVDAFADELDMSNDFLLLKDGASVVIASCWHSASNSVGDLIDATVDVTGIVRHRIFGARKFVGSNLRVLSGDSIRVVTPAPKDPFDFPPLERFIYTRPTDVLRLGKRLVTGTILATWAPNNCLLRTDDRRTMCLSLARGQRLPLYGEHVKAVGYPATDVFRINLIRVRLRGDAGSPFADDTPQKTSGRQLFKNKMGESRFDDNIFGGLFTLRGIVRDLPRIETGVQCLTLDCDGISIQVDCSANPSAAQGVDLGNRIEVTGRCVFNLGQWQAQDVFPRIGGITIVVRKPADIRIVTGSPYWTPGRLRLVIVALLGVLVTVYLRSRLLKRIAATKLAERTNLAVELHDSLSQALTGLACQITAARNDGDLAATRKKLDTATRMLQSSRAELRNCLFDLRNNVIFEKTFDRIVRRTLEPFADLVELSIRFNVSRAPFDDTTVHAVASIVRELVSNAVRHGNAWTVRIAGTFDGGLLAVSVRDDGVGFDPTACAGCEEGHFGLEGIRERIEKLNGTFDLRSSAGGTRAVIRIPVRKP